MLEQEELQDLGSIRVGVFVLLIAILEATVLASRRTHSAPGTRVAPVTHRSSETRGMGSGTSHISSWILWPSLAAGPGELGIGEEGPSPSGASGTLVYRPPPLEPVKLFPLARFAGRATSSPLRGADGLGMACRVAWVKEVGEWGGFGWGREMDGVRVRLDSLVPFAKGLEIHRARLIVVHPSECLSGHLEGRGRVEGLHGVDKLFGHHGRATLASRQLLENPLQLFDLILVARGLRRHL